MTDTEYIARLKEHLAGYRVRALQVEESGHWGTPPSPYGHILPMRYRERNIVASIRDRFWVAQADRKWGLHQYFHHLSSSQALAFNLFFAAYPELPTTFIAFRRALGLNADGRHSVDFEVVLDQKEGTNIDVLLTAAAGLRTVIEVKLTERSFGRARADERHLDKLNDVYRPRLVGRIADECLEPKCFFSSYQLFRNVAQIRPGHADRVVFLMPRGRTALWAHAMAWCQSPRLGEMRDQVAVVATEDMVEALVQDSISPDMPAGLAAEILAKYSLANNRVRPTAAGTCDTIRATGRRG